MSGWIGVDLDGTLAAIEHAPEDWDGTSIGKPVPAMLARVKRWLERGREVRIVTARVARVGRTHQEAARQEGLIHSWCLTHLGQSLRVTAQKDYQMIELWDDRAVQVEPNTGRRMDGKEEA